MDTHYAAVLVIGLLVLSAGAGCLTTPDPRPGEAGDRRTVPDDTGSTPAGPVPPPGELVRVNGTRMHLWCTGSGSPAVILEAGSTDCSLSWSRVQPAVAGFTRVCSYDRAGYGWSDPVGGPLTAGAVTGRLHALLVQANVSPPYVLAGHSLGGEYVRAYASRYPDEIAGMVLVDPGSEWQMVRTGENFTRTQQKAIAGAVAGLRADAERARNGTFARNLSLVPVDPRLPADAYSAYRALLANRSAFWEARALEAESAFAIFDELMQENLTVRKSLPLIVIASGDSMGFSPDPAENAHANRVFRALQQEIAGQSSRGEYRVAPGTSHYVQLDRPDLVTGAILSVVNTTRAGGSANGRILPESRNGSLPGTPGVS